MARNVNEVLKHQKEQKESEHVSQLIKSLSQSQLATLNSIINLSEFHLECLQGKNLITKGEQTYQMEVIWSSAKLLELGTHSQLT